MSFGTNLQFIRRMHNTMTQEELAEKLGVSRQTISKWEMDGAFPEMEKAIALGKLFNCSMDELFNGNMDITNSAYSNIRIENVKQFSYVSYTVISVNPEQDALGYIESWAAEHDLQKPDIIGWDFPFVSQEQVNVYHMHGYCALVLLQGRRWLIA